MRHAVIAGSLIGVAANAAAQQPAAAFDVASIKPNTEDSSRTNLDLQPGGRFVGTNVALLPLIGFAYGDGVPLPPNRIVRIKGFGGGLMLARADGRLGPKLRPSAVDCSDPNASAAKNDDGTSKCGFRRLPGKATGRATMAQLAVPFLNGAVDDHRPVEDHTGLSGTFEFDIEWTPTMPIPADAPPGPPVDPNGAPLFTALREQLGLKLEPAKNTIDILVVDRAEHPAEN